MKSSSVSQKPSFPTRDMPVNGTYPGDPQSGKSELTKDQQDQMELRERVIHNKLKPQYESSVSDSGKEWDKSIDKTIDFITSQSPFYSKETVENNPWIKWEKGILKDLLHQSLEEILKLGIIDEDEGTITFSYNELLDALKSKQGKKK